MSTTRDSLSSPGIGRAQRSRLAGLGL